MKLPTLEALMGEFDVARVTVRQAMELLARDGLVSAERGRGTFVTAQPTRDKRLMLETVIPVLLELPRVEIARAWQTLEIGTADVTVARHLGIHVNAPVAEVRRVCQAKDQTVLYLGEVTYRGDYIHLEIDLKP